MSVTRWLGRSLSTYRVVLLVLAVGAAATWLARWALGPDPSQHDIDRLGFGLPALEDGRWWTLLTGMVLTKSLSLPFPVFSLIGVALYEAVARHWRTVVVLVAGQVLGVLAVCALLYPVRNVDNEWVQDMAGAVDFGMSVGGFATLGAWTAYLSAPWRRRLRLGLSAYFPGPLVVSGLIYDLTHPAGWLIGIALGVLLVDPSGPRQVDRTPLHRNEAPWLAVACILGALAGVYAGHL